jgi:hypothetical protein
MFLVLGYLLRLVKAFGLIRGLEISGWALGLNHLFASPTGASALPAEGH